MNLALDSHRLVQSSVFVQPSVLFSHRFCSVVNGVIQHPNDSFTFCFDKII